MPSARSAALRMAQAFDRISMHLPRVGKFSPPRGTFSALETVRSGATEGHIFIERQTPGSCPADSITSRCGMEQHDHQPWPVFWAKADDARLFGRLAQWRNPEGKICIEGCYNHPARLRLGEEAFWDKFSESSPQDLPGAWTSILSNWGDGTNYFHWLTDCLTRLWVWERLPEPTKILIPENPNRFVRESIELLGLSDRCESVRFSCVRPGRYYFCGPLTMTGVYNPLGFDWLRERFSAYFHRERRGPAVFLTRRAKTRVPPELPRLEELFSAAGFEIVDCGAIGFQQQIEMASAATAIAGIHGAAMTNVLWARPGTPVLEIFEPKYLNGCYEQMAFQGKLHYKSALLTDATSVAEIENWLRKLPSQEETPASIGQP